MNVTQEDIDLVRQHYPIHGAKRVARMLGRSPHAVHQIASKERIPARGKESLFGLTAREVRALKMFAAGLTGPEISAALRVGKNSAPNLLGRAREKIGGKTNAAMVLIAERAGLLDGVEP